MTSPEVVSRRGLVFFSINNLSLVIINVLVNADTTIFMSLDFFPLNLKNSLYGAGLSNNFPPNSLTKHVWIGGVLLL